MSWRLKNANCSSNLCYVLVERPVFCQKHAFLELRERQLWANWPWLDFIPFCVNLLVTSMKSFRSLQSMTRTQKCWVLKRHMHRQFTCKLIRKTILGPALQELNLTPSWHSRLRDNKVMQKISPLSLTVNLVYTKPLRLSENPMRSCCHSILRSSHCTFPPKRLQAHWASG